MIKRKKPKVIRSVRFNKSKDPDNYFREQLMLYVPWRNEANDIIEHYQSYQERYETLYHLLSVNRMKYEHHTDILEKAFEDLNTLDSDETGNIAPCTQHSDEQDQSTERKESQLFGCFDPGDNKVHSQYDLLDDVGIFPRLTEDENLSATKPIDDTDYRCLVRSLNREQMEFFYHILHSVKVSDKPLTMFLSGGAGVGKSWLISALYYAITKHLDGIAGENPDDIKVLKIAPTGKAAYNIGGNTIHSTFQIPANRGFR